MPDEPTTLGPAEWVLDMLHRQVEYTCKVLEVAQRWCLDRSEVSEGIAPLVEALKPWTAEVVSLYDEFDRVVSAIEFADADSSDTPKSFTNQLVDETNRPGPKDHPLS